MLRSPSTITGPDCAETARISRRGAGLGVVLERVVDQQGSQLFYLARVPVEHELSLGGPEQLRNRPGNSYQPTGVPLGRANTLPLGAVDRRHHWQLLRRA